MSVQGTRDDAASEVLRYAPRAQSAEPGAEAKRPRRPFAAPQLTRHAPLTRITLVSGTDFGGSGGTGGTFFGS